MFISPITIQPWPLPSGNTGIVPPWLRRDFDIAKQAAITIQKETRQDYHIVPSGIYWAVKREGSVYAEKFGLTKAEALGYGIEQARAGAVSLVIHGRTGRIQTVYSYDNVRWPD